MRWLCLFTLLCASLCAQPLDISIAAEGAILMNAKTGAILYEKNAHTKTYPASTTKVATALYALERAGDRLDELLVAKHESIASITPQAKKQSNYRSPPHWLETDGGHIGIKKGEEMPLHDLLYAALVASANDACNVIAQNLGGTIPRYMQLVNGYLESIGCHETHFNNPHGLHHPDHVTTPYDLAIMTREAMQNPRFREMVKTVRYTCPQTNLEYERTFVQTNHLVRHKTHHYPKAIGVKTGSTQAAGKNLVAAASENGRELIAVALGYRGKRAQLYADVTKLFEAAFSEPKMRRYLLPKGAQKLTMKVKGARRKLKTYLPEGLYYDFYPAEDLPVKATLLWDLPSLPIAKDMPVATLKIIDQQGTVIKCVPLLAHTEVKPTWLYRLMGENGWRKVLFCLGVAALLLFFYRLRKKRRHRPLYR